ncbi:DUF2867 domain-containing protein [Luteimonas sp. 9C]|uniref:DUF2867 domain-containing protein n=1 Tax=Luteimonas sp. 9C TaxID=2653148 RepID=UPI001358C802|nr:DUF2867 domain-containing protein [Luteimonas sp. 9C]
MPASGAAATFPAAHVPSRGGGLPVEVTLIARFAPGQGDAVIGDALRRQRAHPAFVDALDEPSTRIGVMDLARGDPSSLYTFGVGAKGHPFHRHAGNRMFTAVSGSAGAHLRFSTASQAQIDADPGAFVDALHVVEVPADCLFSVRFGGGTWHQFMPAQPGSVHPALFAVSCHPDETAGGLDAATQARVLDNAADIPALTDVLPAAVQALLDAAWRQPASIATTRPSLDPAPVSCTRADAPVGGARAADAVDADSLLQSQLPGPVAHEDQAAVRLDAAQVGGATPAQVMDALLAGFVANPPVGVGRLMALRNLLVRPAGLRTSPLGCPASSLLSVDAPQMFAGRHPVLVERLGDDGRRVEVILGADDVHLMFRTCIGVRAGPDGTRLCTMATRVRTRNAFGRVYMAVIRGVHRRYIAPTMLRHAADHAVRALRQDAAVDMAPLSRDDPHRDVLWTGRADGVSR